MTRSAHFTRIAAKPTVVLCASISLLAHAVLLGSLALSPPSGPAKPRASAKVSALHVRTLSVARAETAPAAIRHEANPPTEPETSVAEDSARSDQQADVAQAKAPATIMEAATPEPAQVAQADTATGPTDQDGQSAYVPRPLLSMAPVAQGPVIIEPPVGETVASRHVGILSLFIDEEGRVHHIVPDEPRLPPMFERAAYDAFMAVRYAPGKLDGQAVKARIRVEVVFDNTQIASQ